MDRTPQSFDSLTSLRLHLTLIASLSPVALFACLSGGWYVAFVIVSTMSIAWLADAVFRFWGPRREPEDSSALLWGLTLALVMPPLVPFWIPWAGILFSILAKGLLGGSGASWLNPALTAWAFCQAGWPAAMRPAVSLSGASDSQITSMLATRSSLDQGATDWLNGNIFSWLNLQVPAGYVDLVTGVGLQSHSWNAEAGTFFLLAATVFLLVRGTIPWQIPLFFFLGFAVPVGIFGGLPAGQGLFSGDVLFQIFSGTFLLGIFFLATDTSSRPLSSRGLTLYALGAGVLAFVLRTWGVHVEGVGYAILFMNFLVPWMDLVLRKKVLNDLR